MYRSHNRALRATLAIGSFASMVLIGVPWVDEYLGRRTDAVELSQLREELDETTLRDQKLQAIASKLVDSLTLMEQRSIQSNSSGIARERLTEIVRKANGRLRHIEVAPGNSRPWGIENDSPVVQKIPELGEESGFLLNSIVVDLRVTGTVESIERILREIQAQGWMTLTSSLVISPADGQGTEISLEYRFSAFGLQKELNANTDEFAGVKVPVVRGACLVTCSTRRADHTLHTH